jgi:hypothetical protein
MILSDTSNNGDDTPIDAAMKMNDKVDTLFSAKETLIISQVEADGYQTKTNFLDYEAVVIK